MAENITVSSTDEVFSLACPLCDYKQFITAKSVLRGVTYICEGCGSLIETSSQGLAHRKVTVAVELNGFSQSFEITARPDGPWVFLDDAERSVLSVLEHDSDRSIAIIVGSMIESRLKRLILFRLKKDRNIEDRLFQTSGPIGTFSSKIDLAFMLGLVTRDAHHDLVLIKDVRNLFAHNLGIKDFQSQRIKDKTDNFRLIRDSVGEFKASPEGHGTLVNLAKDEKPVIFVKNMPMRRKSARDRYLLTAQVFTVRLAPAELSDYPLPFI